jgi:outer membrane lipoprotein-sorting protein
MNEPTETHPRDEADNLQRALAEINRQADEQAIADQTLLTTLAKMRQTADAKAGFTKTIILRITNMTYRQRIAAAFTLTLGGLAIWAAFSLLGGFATVTYAQVAQQILTARTMSCNETVGGGQLPMPVTMKAMFSDGRVRMEYAQGNVMIFDQSKSQSLILDPTAKTAQIIKMTKTTGAPEVPSDPMQDPAAFFRNLAAQNGEPIEDRQINGVTAKGFRTKSFGFPASLWVDPATKMPLRVEIEFTMGKQKMNAVMSDFVFDAPLDDRLFSLDPPQGYTLKDATPLVVDTDLGDAVVTMLGAYAAASGGTFPASLTDSTDLAKMLAGHMKNGQFDDGGRKLMTSLGVVMGTMISLKQGTDYDYTPDGVKLGESDKRIFWYHQKEKNTYRAIDGDLHITDVAPADLPITK